MATFADVKKKAKLPEKSVPLCLAGDLQAEFEELERQLQIERTRPDKPGATMAASGRSPAETELAQRIEALRERMQADTTVFRLRALPKKKWSDLVAAHKPRPEDKENGLDYNGDTLPVALVAACCVDPQMSVPEVEELVDEVLSQGQWDELYSGAFFLNRRKVDIPFSASASAILSSTGAN
ncbi:hypothetical protein ACFOY2_05390 [Nonomuraea purpurea]|uniref:Uncharacterized protein n=1 Tax=Nonomuraea purpurea TaxID=1849276 RepID=A0ABV8G337_9ACTN